MFFHRLLRCRIAAELSWSTSASILGCRGCYALSLSSCNGERVRSQSYRHAVRGVGVIKFHLGTGVHSALSSLFLPLSLLSSNSKLLHQAFVCRDLLYCSWCICTDISVQDSVTLFTCQSDKETWCTEQDMSQTSQDEEFVCDLKILVIVSAL